MEALSRFISENWIYALGWTVVHSLWQGALLAMVLALFRKLTERLKPQIRYAGGLVALGLVFLLSALTFSLQLQTAGVGEGVVISNTGISEAGDPSLLARSTGILNRNLPLLVAAWMAGMAFFALRTLGGFWVVTRLRHSGQALADGFWEKKMTAIAERMQISRAVRLLESAQVSVPLVIGHLKPVILLPVGLVNQLSPSEVEAVLAHELAHIRRWDYLFNLLQSALEILYYFNPAVWYISTTVRDEREHCCDDWAVALCGSSLTYVHALVRLQERAAGTPQFALSMAGGGKPLLKRVRRILNQPNHKKTIMERFTATLLLLAAVAVFSISASQAEANDPEADAFPALASFEQTADSIPPPPPPPPPRSRQRIVKEEGDRRLELTMDNGAVVEFKVNGETIPSDQLGAYQKEIDGMKMDIRRPGALAPAPPAPPAPPVRIEKEIRIKTEKEGDDKVMIWIEEDEGAPREIIIDGRELEGKVLEFREQEEPMKLSEEERARAPFVWQGEAPMVMRGGNLKSAIEKELRRDGYIRQDGTYQFELSGKKLVINGKKESDVIFEKYKKIYERHTGLSLSRNSKIEVEN
jgi:bla regulator protein BlaR1